MLHGLTHDLRYAFRALTAAPGFSFGLIGSLTLGIAANAVAFATINALYFRALPGVEAQDRLARIELCRDHHGNCIWADSTYDDYVTMRSALPSAAELSARVQLLAAARIRGEAITLRAAVVSPNYFDVLGARLSLGAGFPSGARASEQAVAVISDGLWRRQFQRNPAVLGEFIDLGTTAVRIVGVAPEDFLGATPTFGIGGREIWVPFAIAAAVIPRSPSAPSRR